MARAQGSEQLGPIRTALSLHRHLGEIRRTLAGDRRAGLPQAMTRWSAVVAILLLSACKASDRSKQGEPAAAARVSDTRIAAPRSGPAHEWPMPGADYSNSRYSELAQITPTNAKNLRVAWTFSTGVLRGHEGQPLVVGHTKYLVTPYPNV